MSLRVWTTPSQNIWTSWQHHKIWSKSAGEKCAPPTFRKGDLHILASLAGIKCILCKIFKLIWRSLAETRYLSEWFHLSSQSSTWRSETAVTYPSLQCSRAGGHQNKFLRFTPIDLIGVQIKVHNFREVWWVWWTDGILNPSTFAHHYWPQTDLAWKRKVYWLLIGGEWQ